MISVFDHRDIAAAGLPTVIVMEDRYTVDALGQNVAALLWASRKADRG